MNLGGVFFKTAILILAGAFLLPLIGAWIIRIFKKLSWGLLMPVALCLTAVLAVAGLETLHRPIFVAWHRAQNTMVPRTGCVSYEPDFTRLCATYRMDRKTFDQWVAAHPWKLLPFDLADVPSFRDREHLGFSNPEAVFATEPAPNGKQLRVYYEKGTIYLAYNSM
jgi:hypothetical protein